MAVRYCAVVVILYVLSLWMSMIILGACFPKASEIATSEDHQAIVSSKADDHHVRQPAESASLLASMVLFSSG